MLLSARVSENGIHPRGPPLRAGCAPVLPFTPSVSCGRGGSQAAGYRCRLTATRLSPPSPSCLQGRGTQPVSLVVGSWLARVFGGDDRIRTGGEGFADPCLTTWRRRRGSGRRDSNPRPSPWQGDALPLSHSREWRRLMPPSQDVIPHPRCACQAPERPPRAPRMSRTPTARLFVGAGQAHSIRRFWPSIC